MYEAKTKPTTVDFEAYLSAVEDDQRRMDCRQLATIFQEVTGEAPVMWGTSIVGFGSYHYKYDSGHEGDAAKVAFSNRKSHIVLYGLKLSVKNADQISRLGVDKQGKGCLYIKRFADLNLEVFKELTKEAILSY